MEAIVDVSKLDVAGKFLVLNEPADHGPFTNVFVTRAAYSTGVPVGAIDLGNRECLLAFSRLCTHMGCHLANVDAGTATGTFRRLSANAKFSSVIICPCHATNFDLLQRGLPVIGPATDCLPQVALERVDTQRVRLTRWMRGHDVPYGVPFAGTSLNPPETPAHE
jgi:Rieske Fe-S protein